MSYEIASEANPGIGQIEHAIQETAMSKRFLPVIILCAALARHMELFTYVLVPMILLPQIGTAKLRVG